MSCRIAIAIAYAKSFHIYLWRMEFSYTGGMRGRKELTRGYIDFKCFIIALYSVWSIICACWFEFISADALSFLRGPLLYGGSGGVVLTHKRLIFSLAIFNLRLKYDLWGQKKFKYVYHSERIWVKLRNCDRNTFRVLIFANQLRYIA